MADDPAKRKRLSEARRAQSQFERSDAKREDARKARNESFERASKQGSTLREIGEAVGLHWTRIREILDKK